MLELLAPPALNEHPHRVQFRQYVENWGGRAAVDSVGYRLVRDFRQQVDVMVFSALTAPCRKMDPPCDYHILTQREARYGPW